MKPSKMLTPGLIALTALMFGCSDSGTDQTPSDNNNSNTPAGEVVKSTLSRELNPDVAGEDAEALADENQEFAFKLYNQLRTENRDDNLFLSPHSISIALAMLYAGAESDTATQIAGAMNYTLPEEQLHSAFNALDLELAKRGTEELDGDEGGDAFELSIINATWGQTGHPFLDSYLDTLAINYGAGLRVVDFISEPEPSRVRINEWVEEQTNERIKDLLPEQSITVDTRLVLTNAIYFKASWKQKFNDASTYSAAFQLLDGTSVDVDMMRQYGDFRYGEFEGTQVIELPYVGDQVSMIVALPEKDNFADFENSLSGEQFAMLLDVLQPNEGDIELPKFEFESEFGLPDTLEALGMVDAFYDGLADLSGIDGTTDLFVTDVLHKSFVAVDEDGTEAAAATAVIVGDESAPMNPFSMKVDRPFIFAIYDKPSGAILFLGSLIDPSK